MDEDKALKYASIHETLIPSMPFLDGLDPLSKKKMMKSIFDNLILEGDDTNNTKSNSTINQNVKKKRKVYEWLDS